ncbi:MAG TPA: universal stress protein [Longimicrobiales bacterium]|nr:universal stress protein [Longimicrobiales bacterium]
MIRDILVPLDGSVFSEHALPRAVDLARRSGATLHIVQVHEPPVVVDGPESVPYFDEAFDASLRAQEQEYLRSMSLRCVDHGISPRTELLGGSVAVALATYAAEAGIDQIVMTTHGRGGISRLWLGSVADALVRRSTAPLLLVRPRGGPVDWNSPRTTAHVLVPLDGSPLSESVLPAATALGSLTGAHFTLMRVVMPVPFIAGPAHIPPVFSDEGVTQSRADALLYLERVAARLRVDGHTVDTTATIHTSPALAILDRAASVAADVIAMATRGRGGWSRVALGSVADKVMRGTSMPVLLLRPTGHAGDEADGADERELSEAT